MIIKVEKLGAIKLAIIVANVKVAESMGTKREGSESKRIINLYNHEITCEIVYRHASMSEKYDFSFSTYE